MLDEFGIEHLETSGEATTGGHRHKVTQEHYTNNYREKVFAQRLAPVWNRLPLAIVDFTSFAETQTLFEQC